LGAIRRVDRSDAVRASTPELRGFGMQSPPTYSGREAHPELWNRLWRIVGSMDGGSSKTDRIHASAIIRSHAKIGSGVETSTLLLVGENELAPFQTMRGADQALDPDCRRLYLPVVGTCACWKPPRKFPE